MSLGTGITAFRKGLHEGESERLPTPQPPLAPAADSSSRET